MPELPGGTVTFAFTDIEDSTELLKRLGDGYTEVLTGHRRLMRESFTASDGIEMDTQGDAFFFVFARARDAVTAAVKAEKKSAPPLWPDKAAAVTEAKQWVTTRFSGLHLDDRAAALREMQLWADKAAYDAEERNARHGTPDRWNPEAP